VIDCVEYLRDLPAALDALLYDPQTSGGLLISGPVAVGTPIGRVVERAAKPLRVR
jgi:selenophosphate synthase